MNIRNNEAKVIKIGTAGDMPRIVLIPGDNEVNVTKSDLEKLAKGSRAVSWYFETGALELKKPRPEWNPAPKKE